MQGLLFALSSTRYWLPMLFCIWGQPAFAQASGPAQQSRCEAAVSKFRAAHPRASMEDFWKAGINPVFATLPPEPSFFYRDITSGIQFTVDNDGRRVSAADAKGKLLWSRNPFVDANLCPYRSAHPYISWIGAAGGDFGRMHITPFKPRPDAEANAIILQALMPKFRGILRDGDRFAGLAFNSSQFGYLNIRNGDFYYWGQD